MILNTSCKVCLSVVKGSGTLRMRLYKEAMYQIIDPHYFMMDFKQSLRKKNIVVVVVVVFL